MSTTKIDDRQGKLQLCFSSILKPMFCIVAALTGNTPEPTRVLLYLTVALLCRARGCYYSMYAVEEFVRVVQVRLSKDQEAG